MRAPVWSLLCVVDKDVALAYYLAFDLYIDRVGSDVGLPGRTVLCDTDKEVALAYYGVCSKGLRRMRRFRGGGAGGMASGGLGSVWRRDGVRDVVSGGQVGNGEEFSDWRRRGGAGQVVGGGVGKSSGVDGPGKSRVEAGGVVRSGAVCGDSVVRTVPGDGAGSGRVVGCDKSGGSGLGGRSGPRKVKCDGSSDAGGELRDLCSGSRVGSDAAAGSGTDVGRKSVGTVGVSCGGRATSGVGQCVSGGLSSCAGVVTLEQRMSLGLKSRFDVDPLYCAGWTESLVARSGKWTVSGGSGTMRYVC